MPDARILVVDDEPGMLEVCHDCLSVLEHVTVEVEPHSSRAAERLVAGHWDLLVADVRMPGIGGIELLELARRYDRDLPVLMLTAFPTVETAVQSLKLGATDYLTKPFLPEELRAAVRRILESRRLGEENRLLRRHVERSYAYGDMIGRSPRIRAVFDLISRIAPTDVDVLIIGETGTGKELAARSVHQHSRRHSGHFVPVDCGAIPEDLLESEFFGHERGAFTGADARRLGLLEFAGRGTIFFDEIDHLPPKLQAKLLRALQERRIRRVGGTDEFDIDVRVVAATSIDLHEEARQGRFRSDLYYRINVACVELPALRERSEDIPLLISHFTSRFAREMARPPVEFDPEAIEILVGYRWPGNVRELQNLVKRLLVTTRHEVIHVDDLPDGIVASAAVPPTPGSRGFFDLREQHVAAFERQYLAELLTRHGGDVSAAAVEARLPRGTLYRLLKKHGLSRVDFLG